MSGWLKPQIRISLVLLLVVLISACGFRLRGFIELPAELQPLYITSQGGAGNLAATLSRQLQQSGVLVTNQSAASRLRLELRNFGSSERQVVFGAVEEFELTLQVTADARDQQGESLFSDEVFVAQRQYTRDDNLLARDNLRNELLRSMENDLIRQLTLKVQALTYENRVQ